MRLRTRALEGADRLLLLAVEASKLFPDYNLYYIPTHQAEVAVLLNSEGRGVKLSREKELLLILPLVPADIIIPRTVIHFLFPPEIKQVPSQDIGTLVRTIMELALEYELVPILGAAAYRKGINIEEEYNKAVNSRNRFDVFRGLFSWGILGSLPFLTDEILSPEKLLTPENYPLLQVTGKPSYLYGSDKYRLYRGAVYSEKRRRSYTSSLLESLTNAADTVLKELFNIELEMPPEEPTHVEYIDTTRLEALANALRREAARRGTLSEKLAKELAEKYFRDKIIDLLIKEDRDVLATAPIYNVYILTAPYKKALDLCQINIIPNVDMLSRGFRYVVPSMEEWERLKETPLDDLLRSFFLLPENVPVL